jgi:hypothetical protein
MRDFISQETSGEYKLYPYAKDLHYRPDGLVSMTLEIYNGERSEEFSFGFMCSAQLRRFLDRTIGDEYEKEE